MYTNGRCDEHDTFNNHNSAHQSRANGEVRSTPSIPSKRRRTQAQRKLSKYLFAIVFTITYLLHATIIEHELKLVNLHPQHGGQIASTSVEGRRHVHHTASHAAWTESHSPLHVMDGAVRIAFRLHDPSAVPYPDKFLSVKPYTCGDDSDKAPLPPSLSPRSVLNFTTTVATDLRIVHVGDSLGQQFVQGFDASVLGTGYEAHRHVLHEYFYEGRVYSHNCLSVAAPVRGGGVSSYWRVTDLMSLENRRRDAKCAREELKDGLRVGWSMEQSLELAGYKYGYAANASVVGETNHASPIKDDNEALPRRESYPAGPFDAVVMRIPHGWMKIPDITRERLVEAISLANENLGASTVVITTLPLNNNVLTVEDWEGIHDINEMVRDVARTWTPPADVNGRGVRWVLVQEFGDFTNRILWKNAQHLGYPAPEERRGQTRRSDDGWEMSGSKFLLDRLPLPPRKWPPSVPMVCAKTPASPADKDCPRNRISSDGIHWCIETLGPRYAASIACLLGCVYNGGSLTLKRDGDGIRKCERECNEIFMTVDPVDEVWIANDATTLFSRVTLHDIEG